MLYYQARPSLHDNKPTTRGIVADTAIENFDIHGNQEKNYSSFNRNDHI